MSGTALLTGVTGYIGSKLADRLLADGWSVHVIVRPTSDPAAIPPGVLAHPYDGKVEQLIEAVAQAAPDIVFHLASLYLADHRPDQIGDLLASNVLLPTQLAQAMAANGARRLVNTGSASQHYGTADYNPVSLYAATKQACGDILRYYHDAHDLSVVTLKIFDTFGAGDKRRKLVQLIVDAALSGERLEMSPGEQILDLTHIDDIVEAFLIAADRLLVAKGAIFEEFLLSGQRHSIRELVAAIEASMGRPVNAHFGARAYRQREVMVPVVASADLRLPGWRARHRLGDAVRGLANTH